MRGPALAVGVLCVLLLASCGGRSAPAGTRAADPQRGGTLTVLVPHVDSAPDPNRAATVAEAMVHAAVFRQLYTMRPADRGRARTPDAVTEADAPVGDIADGDPAVSADGLTITVHLRGGVRFGSADALARAVNARDVARGMERALTEPSTQAHARRLLAAVQGVPAPGAPLRGDVAGIEAVGQRTLRLHLRAPEARLVVAALGTPLTTPVPASREDVPPWTGPYAPELEGPDGDVVLRRNRAFRPLSDDWRRAYADTVRLQVDDSPGAASRVLSGSGLVLGSQEVPSDVARSASRRGQLIRVVMPVTEYVGINPGAFPFGSESLRQAAVAAIDRQALLRIAGRGGLLASHWLPPGTPGHDQSGGAEGPRYDFLAAPDGDLAVAADYLRRAGYPSGRFTGRPMVAATAGDQASLAVAEAVRDQLARVGFRVILRTMPPAVARSACSSPESGVAICPDAVVSSPVRDPEALLRTGFPGADLLGRFGGDLVALMTLASEARPGEQRARAWADINRDLLRAGAGAPWRWEQHEMLVSGDVRGVMDDGTGTWDLAATSLSPKD